MTLLCPQQWAKQREQDHGWEDGAQLITKGNFSRLEWHNSTSLITIPMDLESNLPILNTTPSFQKSAKMIAHPAVVSDDKNDDKDEGEDDETVVASNETSQKFPFPKLHKPIQVNDPILPKDQAEFMQLHGSLGHTPFPMLKQMASSGVIPAKFASCQHGQQHKRPWQHKNSGQSPIGGKTIKEPGDCVSVDQLKSSTPGLTGQVRGWLGQEQQHVATVFVDHHSDLTFIHVTPSDTSAETVETKEAFECFAAAMNVKVKHYHANNGRFADTFFREHVKEKHQTMSFCGVGAHHQNGKVEKRIKDIVEQARTMLLHAAHR